VTAGPGISRSLAAEEVRLLGMGNGAARRAVAQVAGRACASRNLASMAVAWNGGWERALGFRALGWHHLLRGWAEGRWAAAAEPP
jgi:hypothetical protein